MPRETYRRMAIGTALALAAVFGGPSHSISRVVTATSVTQIPQSLQTEHHAIHAALEEAQRLPGATGEAARHLARVLHPHFVREEEIALPPLGLLAPLAAGVTPSNVAETLAMTDALKKELPQMLAEHTRIRAAVDGLRAAARAAGATRYEQLADQLALHAQTEEEVLYPAAVLVGEIIRARATP